MKKSVILAGVTVLTLLLSGCGTSVPAQDSTADIVPADVTTTTETTAETTTTTAETTAAEETTTESTTTTETTVTTTTTEETTTTTTAAPQEDRKALYRTYFQEHFAMTDLAVLADVTHDGKDELITVRKQNDESGNPEYMGQIFTVSGGEVTQIFSNGGGESHAVGYFNLYLIPDGKAYDIGIESFGMYQGVGSEGFSVFRLTEAGDKLNVREFSTDDFKKSDANTMITDAEMAQYIAKLDAEITGAEVVYAVYSEAKATPKTIDTDPKTVLEIG